MKIARHAYAVFWSRPGWTRRQQFMADLPKALYPTAGDAARGLKEMWPADIIRSVRDSNGRFLPFKGA